MSVWKSIVKKKNSTTIQSENYSALLVPRLKLFSAKRMSDVLDGIAEAMSVVVGGIDAPTIASSMMGHIFNSGNQ